MATSPRSPLYRQNKIYQAMKNSNIFRATAASLLIIAALALSPAYAQVTNAERNHVGIAVAFGTKSAKIASNFSAINGMNLIEEGGSVGVLWGNKVMETKFSAGFYYSSSRVPHTVDLVNLESSVNFYPLSAIAGRKHLIEPYFTAGLAANNYKFYGFYSGTTEGPRNYSVSLEPYLGNVVNYYGSVGTGFEVNLVKQNNFVKLFSEINYNSALIQKSSALFANSRVSNQLSVSIGLSFGLNRF